MSFLKDLPLNMQFDDDTRSMVVAGVCVLGAYQAASIAGRFLKGVWKHLLRPSYDLKKRYSDPAGKEAWAVVTGAAMGIGKEYARQLGAMGFSILAIDKDQQHLEQTKDELSRKGIKVKTIVWDFGKIDGPSSYAEFEKALKASTDGLDVCILVNNAAEFQQEALDVMTVDRLYRASYVNSFAPALLARFFLPEMLSRLNTGKKSAIINVGTNAAEIQNPRYKFAVYGASKAYLHILSSGMQEVWGDQIDIMTAIPRQTKTVMNPVNFCFTGTARGHVRAILSQVGQEKESYGTLTHDLEYFIRFGMFGGFIIDNIVQWLNEKENQKLAQEHEKRLI